MGGVSKDGSTLHIIELKCGNNKGIGVISEILFYTSILYDTCIALDSYFSFGKYKKSHLTPEMEIIQDKSIRKLHSHDLAECYHPLFSNEATSLLQKGLLRLDIVFDRAKYDYKENKLPELYVQ